MSMTSEWSQLSQLNLLNKKTQRKFRLSLSHDETEYGRQSTSDSRADEEPIPYDNDYVLN